MIEAMVEAVKPRPRNETLRTKRGSTIARKERRLMATNTKGAK